MLYAKIFPNTFLYILVSIIIVNSVEINVKIPKVFKVGSPMWINCTLEYIKSNEVINEIKWYKNDQLFFTWDAEKKEGIQVLIPGIGVDNFDIEKSTGNAIYLSSTDLNSTGCYECEVILDDATSKKRSGKTQALYVPLYRPQPMIYVQRYDGLLIDFYIKDMGDMMEVKCSGKPSVPDAEITLLVNGKERHLLFEEEIITKKPWRVYSDDYKRYTLVNYFIISYKFKITPELVENNFMKIACLSIVRAPHGMIEHLESETKKIRVIQTYTRIYSLAHIDNKAYWLYGFIGLIIALLGLWYLVDGNYDIEKVDKKVMEKEMQEDNISNVSSYDYAIKIRRESQAAGTLDTLAVDALRMKAGGPMPQGMAVAKGRRPDASQSGRATGESSMTTIPLDEEEETGRGERIV